MNATGIFFKVNLLKAFLTHNLFAFTRLSGGLFVYNILIII